MLNEEKIILMTKLAIYEKGEGKKEIPMSRYYRNDYVGVHMLYTFLSVTAGYVLLFALYIARDVEEFLSSLTTMDLRKFLFTAVAVYIVAELFFLFVAWLVYRRRFKKNREHLNEYYSGLKRLKKLQKKEQAAAMKMVAGNKAEDRSAPGEDTGKDGISSENPAEDGDSSEEDDIFREPEQKGYFRRRKAKDTGADEGTYGEDANYWYDDEESGKDVDDLYDMEESGEDADTPYGGEGTAKDADTPYGGKESGEGAVDLYDEDDLDDVIDLYDGEPEDDGVYSQERAADDDVKLYDKKVPGRAEEPEEAGGSAGADRKEEAGGSARSDRQEEAGGSVKSGGNEEPGSSGDIGEVRNQSDAENSGRNESLDPEQALEQALKKILLDNSEEDEEDEDGFTFSS